MSAREHFDAWAAGEIATGLSMQISELIAMTDDGMTPLVTNPFATPGEELGLLRARSSVDLHAEHIGRQVLLVFEGGHPEKPIVIGVLRCGTGWSSAEEPVRVQVDADGERMLISARHQLVLRCGKASITLTRAGKVVIEGTYVISKSTGSNRIKGGAIALN